jgi:hypothetical protein
VAATRSARLEDPVVRRLAWQLLAFGFLCSLAACDGDTSKATESSEDPASTQAAARESAASSDVAKYDKSIRKKGCEILSPELVSSTFGVPADDLSQIKMMGCTYTWSAEGQILEARLSMMMVHRSDEIAAQWFANATKDLSAEEAERQLDDVMDKVKDQAAKGEIGDGVTGKNVDTVGKAMTGVVAPGGVRYGDVVGIGDDARINLEDASIWVRVDNLTFSVAAYKGKSMPPVGHKTADLKKLAAAAQAANRAWLRDTFEQRKRDGQKLARAIVGAL